MALDLELQYVTEDEYQEYFGETAPTDIIRLEGLSVSLFNSLYPNRIPDPDQVDNLTEQCQKQLKIAILEQIRWYDENPEVKEGVSGIRNEFQIGKYKAGSGDKDFKGNQTLKRIATNAYTALKDCGFTYLGVQTGRCIRRNRRFDNNE